MKSMTGHGRGESSQNGFKVTVEASSVNRKQAEIALNLPRELEPLEAQARDVINRRIARGRLTIRVTLHAAEGRFGSQVQLNTSLAKAYAREAARLAKELKIEGALRIDTLLRLPGVIEGEREADEAAAFWPALEKALVKALNALVKMREREGTHLRKDCQARIASVRGIVAQVQKQAPEGARRYRDQLMERIRNAGLEGIAADDERLLKEVAFFADRSDVSEELTRLQSHFQQFDDLAKATEPVGRTLDFLAQEMNREVNTIGAKANDSVISRAVVTLKAELEKFREQVQNVE
ncbi:MAG: YicC/YloC family endoribonuclease [Limisphaerales bacterium]